MATIKTVGVVGTGVIGASWTALFLSHGLRVLVADPAPNAADKLSTYIKSVWPALERMGIDDDASPDNYEFVGTDLGEHINKCDFIQEVRITSSPPVFHSRTLTQHLRTRMLLNELT